MTDTLTPGQRSWNMSRIRSTNTRPEMRVRSLLHRMGYRFSLHGRSLPGRPDVVLPKYKTVVFVHGCFWHRHKNCPEASNPKTKKAFWQNKFASNTARDRTNQQALRRLGWRVLIVWECQVLKTPDKVAEKLRVWISK
jgi:DNA mismatch endonuclease (patch repair protein)